MSDLIKRVESATGEDRHLDAYIFAAFHREPIEPAQTWSVLDSFQFRFTDGRKTALYVHEDDVPPYTSSLDAAVSLCERVLTRRHDWQISRLSILVDGEQYAAKVYAVDGGYHSASEAFGATPALALVLAILRAHPDGGSDA